MRHIIWRGTAHESVDLLASIDRHCGCTFDYRGARRGICSAHRMLVDDQRALDGLLFVRRALADRLRRQEWDQPLTIHWPPYVFTPTDRTAAGVDEFLAVCRAEPAVASAHLQRGYFEPWLRDIGRPDLAELTLRLRGADVERFLELADAESQTT